MHEAVLFDLDGTLADTAPDLGAALNALRHEFGLPALPLAQLRPATSSGTRGLLRVGFGIEPEGEHYTQLRSRFLALYEGSLCVGTTLFEGVPALLEELETRGMRWGVVTNKPQRYTLPLLQALGLAQRAACIVSGDTTPHPKPDPAPLLHAAQQLGCACQRCVYVGDDLRDIQAGRAAEMLTVAAGYGYLGADLPIERWGADHTIAAPAELLCLLRPVPC
jgi:phosphoglycolate phosphatase